MKSKSFQNSKTPYSYLSTLSNYPIYIDGEIWKTVEHYYQASKFENKDIRKLLNRLEDPIEVINSAASQANEILPDWEFIRTQKMLDGLKAKFLQHPKLKFELLNIDGKIMAAGDEQNHHLEPKRNSSDEISLGILLMKIRDLLLQQSTDKNFMLPPWIAFSGLGQYDGFWRMGWGEDYIEAWAKYYFSLPDKEAYKIAYPEADDWEGSFA